MDEDNLCYLLSLVIIASSSVAVKVVLPNYVILNVNMATMLQLSMAQPDVRH